MKPWIRHTCWLCAPPRVPFSSQRLGPPLLSLVLGAPSQPRALKAPAAPRQGSAARVCGRVGGGPRPPHGWDAGRAGDPSPSFSSARRWRVRGRRGGSVGNNPHMQGVARSGTQSQDQNHLWGGAPCNSQDSSHLAQTHVCGLLLSSSGQGALRGSDESWDSRWPHRSLPAALPWLSWLPGSSRAVAIPFVPGSTPSPHPPLCPAS